MKKVLRALLINFFCFWLISFIFPAIDYSNDLKVLIIASLTLSFVNFFVKPILNLLFFPLNLITLGTFRWVINIIVIALVTVIIPEFKIHSFLFAGVNLYGFTIPKMFFSLFWSYLLVSFLLAVFSDMIYSIFK